MAGAVVATVFGALGGQGGPDQARNLIIAGAGALLTLVPTGINQTRAIRSRRDRRELEATSVTAIASLINPAIELLGTMVLDPASRQESLGAASQALVHAASMLIGAPQPRSQFFEINGNEMRCKFVSTADGRASEGSRRVFRDEENDILGRQVFQQARNLGAVTYHDLEKSHPPGILAGRSYRTLTSATVFADEIPYGILSVDSPVANSLTKRDEQIVAMLAALLGTAKAIGKNGD